LKFNEINDRIETLYINEKNVISLCSLPVTDSTIPFYIVLKSQGIGLGYINEK